LIHLSEKFPRLINQLLYCIKSCHNVDRS